MSRAACSFASRQVSDTCCAADATTGATSPSPIRTPTAARSPCPAGADWAGRALINGMVYVRGQAADYDGWAAAGATGWAHADVEPYFRRIENYAQGGQGRGRDGPLHVTQVRERFPVADAFLRAAVEDGGRLVEDYNWSRWGSATTRSTSSVVADGARTTRTWLPSGTVEPHRDEPHPRARPHIRRRPMHRCEGQARTVRASRSVPTRGDPDRRGDPLTPAPRALRDRTRGRAELHRRAGAARSRGRR